MTVLALLTALLMGFSSQGAGQSFHLGGIEAEIPVRQQAGRAAPRQVQAGGYERRFHEVVPASVNTTRAVPVIVAFHGGGGRPLAFGRRAELLRLARQGGAVLLLPEGLGRPGGRGGSWNTGGETADGYAEQVGVDDLAFVQAMLADVRRRVTVDPDRIYALGMSKGGMMAYHAACNLDGVFRSIAVVAGTLDARTCRFADQVSLLHIHGTRDENVPFEGGLGALSRVPSPWASAERAVGVFQQANRCSAQTRQVSPARDTTCQRKRCPGGDRVELCLVEGGGHAWPGAEPARWQQHQNVYVSPHFDATAYIAQFFFGQ